MKIKRILLYVGLGILLLLMFMINTVVTLTPEGHGSRRSYVFNKSKYELEEGIDSILISDSIVNRKSLAAPPYNNYYNENGYFTIVIDSIDFCFRYYGDSLEWIESRDSSSIFLVSMIPLNGKLISEENEFKLVENHFINKLKR